MSAQTLYSISKRNNTKVDLEILQKISDALSVTLDYFCTKPGKAESYNTNILISKIDRQFINNYISLSDQGKEYMLNTIEIVKE